MKRKLSISICLFSFLVLSAFIGCGPSRGDLSGKVTYKGEVVKYGAVTVEGGNGEPKQGPIGKDGTYTIQGVVAGKVKIAVNSPDPGLSQAKARKKEDKVAAVDKEGWFPIPENYGDVKTSNLTYELKPGPNKFDIELK